MQDEKINNNENIGHFFEKRNELETLISANSCLIDLLKDACEFNSEVDYVSNIYSALSVISEKQIAALQIVSELSLN